MLSEGEYSSFYNGGFGSCGASHRRATDSNLNINIPPTFDGSKLPKRNSALDLEDMIGSSLAFAINSLDQTTGQISPLEKCASPASDEDIPSPSNPYYINLYSPSYPSPMSETSSVHSQPRKPSNVMDAASSCSSTATTSSSSSRPSLLETTAGVELVQFLLETESRALVIFNVETIPTDHIHAVCDRIGTMTYFRTDFKASKGVVFLAYSDLRASIRAFHTLARDLLGEKQIMVHYSIMINAATSPRDGILLLTDPAGALVDSDVQSVFSAYGQLKNVHRRIADKGLLACIYVIEFYDVQDAKVAASDLCHNTPWGAAFSVEKADRPEKEKLLGQQLVATMHRWRLERGPRMASLSTLSSLSDDNCLSPTSSISSISPPQVVFFKTPPSPYGMPATTRCATASNSFHHSSYRSILDGIPEGNLDDNLCHAFKGFWLAAAQGAGSQGSSSCSEKLSQGVPAHDRSPQQTAFASSRRTIRYHMSQ